MFLAELAYNTVEEEIKELEEKQHRRQQSLVESARELEADKTDLQTYIGKDRALREKKEEQEKELHSKKIAKEDTLKKLDIQISQVRSEVEKDKDDLGSLKSN